MEAAIPVLKNPIFLFNVWLEDSRRAGMRYGNAFTLATVDESGRPDSRVVLLKGVDDRGFVFYTNFESIKARQLIATRHAAMCFYWELLGRQVRIRGPIEEVSAKEADEYFASRPRMSQVGAWASRQSEEIASREELEAHVRELEEKYEGKEIPRPPHWSGFRVKPQEIEFWREGEYRLHDRLLYTRAEDGSWQTKWLSP